MPDDAVDDPQGDDHDENTVVPNLDALIDALKNDLAKELTHAFVGDPTEAEIEERFAAILEAHRAAVIQGEADADDPVG